MQPSNNVFTSDKASLSFIELSLTIEGSLILNFWSIFRKSWQQRKLSISKVAWMIFSIGDASPHQLQHRQRPSEDRQARRGHSGSHFSRSGYWLLTRFIHSQHNQAILSLGVVFFGSYSRGMPELFTSYCQVSHSLAGVGQNWLFLQKRVWI